ncbi:MAG: SAM-dependent methyltransferase [Alphaproteobacteria bacterium]|nr:SAM-dependent methyltransferase [Alphaproteobacteria bacterium]
MRLDRFMGLANAHYYATRDPLGASGDFTTAPEISQLFGEMIGLCLVDHWERSGVPGRIDLVELGPGRGTLMADILRAARIRPAFARAARVTLVETSPALRARQAETLKAHDIAWRDSFAGIGGDAPLYLVANEFFDALPIRQFVGAEGRWRERYVALSDEGFAFTLQPSAPPRPLSAPQADTLWELNEPTAAIAAAIGARLAATGGLALVIDYGHARSAPGDTLQAVRRHAFTDPLDAIGEADLTAHVDFEALAAAAGVAAYGPVTQGTFLTALGIEARAATLGRARPDQAEVLAAAVARLTGPDQMGSLFKAMALTGPGGPVPAGFGS